MAVTLAKSKPMSILDPVSQQGLKAWIQDISLEEFIHQAATKFGSACLSAGELTKVLQGKETEKENAVAPKSKKPSSVSQDDIPFIDTKTAEGWQGPRTEMPRVLSIMVCGVGQILQGRLISGMCLTVLFCIGLALFFLYHRKRRLVCMDGPPFGARGMGSKLVGRFA